MNDSVYVDWMYVDETERMKRNCLKNCQFSSADIDLILKMSSSAQDRFFELLKNSSWHVPKELLK